MKTNEGHPCLPVCSKFRRWFIKHLIANIQRSNETKIVLHSMNSWLVNRDPCNGVLASQHSGATIQLRRFWDTVDGAEIRRSDASNNFTNSLIARKASGSSLACPEPPRPSGNTWIMRYRKRFIQRWLQQMLSKNTCALGTMLHLRNTPL